MVARALVKAFPSSFCAGLDPAWTMSVDIECHWFAPRHPCHTALCSWRSLNFLFDCQHFDNIGNLKSQGPVDSSGPKNLPQTFVLGLGVIPILQMRKLRLRPQWPCLRCLSTEVGTQSYPGIPLTFKPAHTHSWAVQAGWRLSRCPQAHGPLSWESHRSVVGHCRRGQSRRRGRQAGELQALGRPAGVRAVQSPANSPTTLQVKESLALYPGVVEGQ